MNSTAAHPAESELWYLAATPVQWEPPAEDNFGIRVCMCDFFACVCGCPRGEVSVCIFLLPCAFPMDFCDATEVIGCVTPTKNLL